MTGGGRERERERERGREGGERRGEGERESRCADCTHPAHCTARLASSASLQ